MSDTVASAESLTDPLDLQSKVALVTGSGQGVDATTARFLGAQPPPSRSTTTSRTARNASLSTSPSSATPAVSARPVWRRVLSQYLIRRVGEPTVAAMVSHLTSEAGSWMTGQTHPVNGGFSVTQ